MDNQIGNSFLATGMRITKHTSRTEPEMEPIGQISAFGGLLNPLNMPKSARERSYPTKSGLPVNLVKPVEDGDSGSTFLKPVMIKGVRS